MEMAGRWRKPSSSGQRNPVAHISQYINNSMQHKHIIFLKDRYSRKYRHNTGWSHCDIFN